MAFMCNTSKIKSMKLENPKTVMFEGEDKPNGTIVTLKATQEKTKGREYDHVHAVEFLTSETDAVEGKYIIVAPEINVEQYRLIDNQISKFVLEADETYAAYRLQVGDRIEYTEGYFASVAGLVVGDFVNVNASGKLEKDADGTETTSAFRVVSILPAQYPIAMKPGKKSQAIGLMPEAGKKIKLEVVR